jgi:uncharacterized membrane protein YeaQ/YmgE (transglycosylase-associated protein family)
MFIPTSVIILSIIVAGLPGAFLGGAVTWRRRRHLYGAVLGWFAGLLGAVIGAIAEMGIETFLPHHEVRDVFGPVRVADYPSEEVLITIRIGSALLGSVVLGWLSSCLVSRRRKGNNVELTNSAD